MDVNAADTCRNCHCDFADHNYVADSITQYKCPHPHIESGYGFFHGGDPRMFHPDGEDCSQKERENHKAACALWDEAEARGEEPQPEKCPSGWILGDDGVRVCHVLKAPYGIGIYTMEHDQFFEAREHDYQD